MEDFLAMVLPRPADTGAFGTWAPLKPDYGSGSAKIVPAIRIFLV